MLYHRVNIVNAMRTLEIEKVTVNIGVGESGDKLQKAKKLLERITGRTAILTKARKREQVFKIRKGDEIGVKVTIRGKAADEFLVKAFEAVDQKLKMSSLDKYGNFSFGVREYIDFPGVRYDPTIGLVGFDVCVTMTRPGVRVIDRRRKRSVLPVSHRGTRDEVLEILKDKYKINIVE